MPNPSKLLRKSYAMSRMGKAIQRAIAAVSNGEKTQGAKWAAAWGRVIGISTVPFYGREPNPAQPRRDSERLDNAPSDNALGVPLTGLDNCSYQDVQNKETTVAASAHAATNEKPTATFVPKRLTPARVL